MVPCVRYKVLNKQREKDSVVRMSGGIYVQVVVIRNFSRGLAVRLQGGNRCEGHVGSRMESGYLQHRTTGLHGGREDETGREVWRCHSGKGLSASSNGPGFNSENHEK